MKQLLIFGLLLSLFSCGDEDVSQMSTEEPQIDTIILYGLNRQLSTDEWQSDRVIEYDTIRNEVTFAEPANFEALNTEIVIALGDDGEFGPSAYDLYSSLGVQAFGDTIRIQIEWETQGGSTLRSCESQYVKF